MNVIGMFYANAIVRVQNILKKIRILNRGVVGEKNAYRGVKVEDTLCGNLQKKEHYQNTCEPAASTVTWYQEVHQD
jgi:hypothetical protein